MSAISFTAEQNNLITLRLEAAERECTEKASFYYNGKVHNTSDYENLYWDITEILTECLSSVLHDLNLCSDIFVAPNYRGVRGSLQEKSPENKKSTISKKLDYHEYTDRYGRHAEHGAIKLGEKVFMPVAFWAYKIYERKLQWDNGSLKMAGFSGWMADIGYLLCQNNPVFAFHTTYGAQTTKANSKDGFLHVNTKDINERDTERPLSVTRVFAEHLDKLGLKPKAVENVLPKLPLITLTNIQDESILDITKKISENVFSLFFHSNFEICKPLVSTDDNVRNSFIQKVIGFDDSTPYSLEITADTQKFDSLSDLVLYFLIRYRDQAKKAKDNILTYPHYYALLLNPGLNFTPNSNSSTLTSLGTVNVYTRQEIPSNLFSAFRTTANEVYRLLRGIDEWFESRQSGISDVSAALGHEVTKSYKGAYNTCQYLVTEKGLSTENNNFLINVIKSTLLYGMLWGNSTYAEIPNEAMLWDKRGTMNDKKTIFKSYIQNAWRNYIISDVLREVSAKELGSDRIGLLQVIWETDAIDQLFILHDDKTFFYLPDSFLNNHFLTNSNILDIYSEISKAVFRFCIPAISNAIKHTLSNKINNDMKAVDVLKSLITLIPELSPNINIKFNYETSSIEIQNNCSNAGYEDTHWKKRSGTESALIMAARELGICLQLTSDPQILFSTNNNKHISSLDLGFMNFQKRK